MSTLLKYSSPILILLVLFFSCGNESSSENQKIASSASAPQEKMTASTQDTVAHFSMKMEDHIFQFQKSENADMHILGGTVGGMNTTVNVNWETSDSEYGAQLMFRAIPEKLKTYQKLDPKAESIDESVSFVFTRTKADDFLMLMNDYEVLVEEYKYKNDAGFFTNQKLSCTITGTINSIDMATRKESVLPFEAKIRIAQ